MTLLPDVTPIPTSTTRAKKIQPPPIDAERRVFDAFLAGRARLGVQGAAPVFDDRRLALVRARMREGRSSDDLALAAAGIWASTWHVAEGQTRFDLALRDAEHIERFARLERDRIADLARFARKVDTEYDLEDGEPEEDARGSDHGATAEDAAAALEAFGLHEGARVVRERARQEQPHG